MPWKSFSSSSGNLTLPKCSWWNTSIRIGLCCGFSLVPLASCDRRSRKTIPGCFIEVALIGRTISLAAFCTVIQLEKSLLTREETNHLIRTKRRERRKSSKEISTIQQSSINWKEGKKNCNMIQSSGMLWQMWNQLGSFRWCATVRSLRDNKSFIGGRKTVSSFTLTDKMTLQAPPPALPSLPPRQKSVCSDWLQWQVAVNGGRWMGRGVGSQRSSERFWMASATTVRRRAMTDRGSSLPITALPDTIMLAPAWRRTALGKINHSDTLGKQRSDSRQVSPRRIYRWCRGRRLRPLRCRARGTDASAKSPGNTEGESRLRRSWILKCGEKWNSCQAKRGRGLGGEEETLECGVGSSQTLRERSPQTDRDLYLALVQHKFVWFSRDSGGVRGGSGVHGTAGGDFGSPGTWTLYRTNKCRLTNNNNKQKTENMCRM